MENPNDRAVEEKVEHSEISSSALQNEAARELSSRISISGNRAELLDTMRKEVSGKRVGVTDPEGEMTATIMVRSKASEREINDTLQKVTSHQLKALDANE